MITLKDFVRDTLKQIVDGANEFDAENDTGHGMTAFPDAEIVTAEAWAQHGMILLKYEENTNRAIYATMIDFDVAITAQESEGAAGGAGIKVVSLFNASGEINSETVNSSVSRVRFKLPLKQP